MKLNTPCGKTAGNLNVRNIFHYIRSLTPWEAHGEYARYPFNMRQLMSGFMTAGALTALFLAANTFLSVPALAVPSGRVLEWKTGISTVTFDGRAHAEKGLGCSDCHPKPFMMVKGYAKMKMVEIIAGKYCGECHDGKRAFPSDKAEKCAKCHKM